jgi:hypothetical protein
MLLCEAVWRMISDYPVNAQENGYLAAKRARQTKD